MRTKLMLIAALLTISCGSAAPERLGGEARVGTSVYGSLVAPASVARMSLGHWLGEDGIDPSATPEENAALVGQKIAGALRIDPRCSPDVSVAGATVTAHFAGSCTNLLAFGMTVSGTMQVTLSAGAASTIVSRHTFTDLSVNGYPAVDGTAEVTFVPGVHDPAAFTAETTSDEATLHFDGTMTFAGYLALEGSGTYADDEHAYDLALHGVEWWANDCFPSSGSVTITLDEVSETLEYEGLTPTTGEARLTFDGTSVYISLQRSPSCGGL